MVLPPGRPPDDCRRRHEKQPVTAPSHNPTSGYDIPACQISKNLARIAAPERKKKLDTSNRRLEQEQFANKLAAGKQCPDRTITANDRATWDSKKFEIQNAYIKRTLANIQRNQDKNKPKDPKLELSCFDKSIRFR